MPAILNPHFLQAQIPTASRPNFLDLKPMLKSHNLEIKLHLIRTVITKFAII